MKRISDDMTKIIVVLLLFVAPLCAADWSQFRGPNRSGVSTETGLLKSWPKDGPKMVWSYEGLGAGWGSAAIVKGTVYIVGEIGKKETLFALDSKGALLWKTTYGDRWKRSFPDARTTPTVVGADIFVNSGGGTVVCFDRRSGAIKWRVDTMKKFDGKYHNWGIAESPLVVDNKVIASPGGKKASVVALDKETGKTVWAATELTEKANYCSPILIDRGGKKIVATMLADHFVGIDAANGKVLWKDAFADYFPDAKDINPVSPIFFNGKIYTTSGYDDGGALYDLSADGLSITRVWVDSTLDVHHGGVVLVDGVIYGSNWKGNRNGDWVALDWKSGKVLYEHHWSNKGAIIAADGMLYVYTEEDGHVGLVRPNPKKFDLVSSFEVTMGDGEHWAHPSISNGRLYVHHGDALMVFDVKAK